VVNVPDFEALYQTDADPWQVQSSFYEARKLDLVLACLSRPTYAAAWDPSCGVGELAARLASRAESVLASDASAQAVQLTRRRCRSAANVTALHLALPDPPPADAGPFDLIVLSEFVYYLTDAQRAMALSAVRDMAAERAEVVAVHWRHHPSDAYLSGEQVQDEIVTQFKQWGGQHVIQHDDREFIIDVLDWGDPPSLTGPR
jgi:hypothetical protein